MTAPTLTEFLLARIAEDEADASGAQKYPPSDSRSIQWRWSVQYRPSGRPKSVPPNSAYVVGAPTPARVLAECEARRQIVAEHVEVVNTYNIGPACLTCWAVSDGSTGPGVWPCKTLRLLALPYADHPDYRQEWVPCRA